MKTRTILLVSNRIPHYRVSVYNYLAERFHEDGWRFVVASEGMQESGRAGVRFQYEERPFQFSAYRQLLQSVEPDVLLCHLHLKDALFWLLLHWAKYLRIPVVCWTKGGNLDRPDSRIRYHMFNYFHTLSDAIILYSERQLSLIKRRSRRKVFAANNAVNFGDYPEVSESVAEIKSEFELPFSKLVLFAGTMGVGGERKKVDHLVEVFRRLNRRDVGLILVGGGMPEKTRRKLNLKNTRYLGEVHDPNNLQVSKLFKAADVFAVPGHLGLGINQAFFWGLPVVTEEGKHPPEIQYLKPGHNGFMVPADDLDMLQEKILLLLDNVELYERMSRNARAAIMRDAPIEGMYEAFLRAVEFVARPAV